ncbi:hypothetical protein L202_02836 [Cryptococcus amylolentus CBS 6039]|uniref:MRH domain-containing protein n=2 Tax=Cryptococcus amylolentus TaxID=104669 RepID=A0A1E3HWG1_9TREE|nr:hypothetical protein L202_02836 [Cryptococcus amylolentus CBS 6039]ODN80657.1 hypothetical protein L202_02836 [Cryptococcus amylolentus CBS 6039]ODO09212.1 hypothetical protein I350_02812 [Cryptococcus amylolentus CBS 6273]
MCEMGSDNPCTLTLEDGTHYDLNQLSSSKADYTAQVGDISYYLNVCKSVVGELYKIDNPDEVGGFVRRPDGDFSLGQVNTNLTLSPMVNDPLLTMTGGSACPGNPSETASTAIRFICSPSNFDAGKPLLVASLPPQDPCHFYFEWSTHVACPTNPKRELESHHYYIAFVAILAIAFLTWFGGVTMYNRLKLKRRGIDQFPLPDFSSWHLPSIHLPSRSNVNSSSNGASRPGWGSWNRRSSGYSNVRADEHDDEETGFAGRFSLEESDEDAEDLTTVGVGEANVWRNHQQERDSTDEQGKGKGRAEHGGLVDV